MEVLLRRRSSDAWRASATGDTSFERPREYMAVHEIINNSRTYILFLGNPYCFGADTSRIALTHLTPLLQLVHSYCIRVTVEHVPRLLPLSFSATYWHRFFFRFLSMFCGRHQAATYALISHGTLITDLTSFGHDLCEIIELRFNFRTAAWNI